MAYALRVLRAAERELKAITPEMARRIDARMQSLRDDPHPGQSLRLKGSSNFRLRVGDYRVIYTVDDAAELVTVVSVGHRRESYR